MTCHRPPTTHPSPPPTLGKERGGRMDASDGRSRAFLLRKPVVPLLLSLRSSAPRRSFFLHRSRRRCASLFFSKRKYLSLEKISLLNVCPCGVCGLHFFSSVQFLGAEAYCVHRRSVVHAAFLTRPRKFDPHKAHATTRGSRRFGNMFV